MSNIYTSSEIEFIQENYPKYGPLYCATSLNRNVDALSAFAARRGIKKIGTYKHPSLQKINPDQFQNIQKPEIAYILGFLWADGYIHTGIANTKSKTPSIFHKINAEIVTSDFIQISHIINSIGTWAIQTRKRKDSWKETTTFSTNSPDLYNFLYENDYNEKSLSEPTKILSKIPDNLKPYWWRGFFDGDGYLSFGEPPHRYKSMGFSSQYNYGWIELKSLMRNLSIEKFNISNDINNRNHGSSKFAIQNIKDIKKLINYFISLDNNICLSRKTEKMINFLNRYPD